MQSVWKLVWHHLVKWTMCLFYYPPISLLATNQSSSSQTSWSPDPFYTLKNEGSKEFVCLFIWVIFTGSYYIRYYNRKQLNIRTHEHTFYHLSQQYHMPCNLWETPLYACERMPVKKENDVSVLLCKQFWSLKPLEMGSRNSNSYTNFDNRCPRESLGSRYI